MAKINFKPAKGIEWDLSDLYSGIDDPKIPKDKKQIERSTKSFTKKYKGKINSSTLNAITLSNALAEYEKILEKLYIYTTFTSYLFAKNTSSEKTGKFYQEAKEFSNKIESELIWFDLEWVDIDNASAAKLIRDKRLEEYKHYLKYARVFKPYKLSLSEEEIMTKKSQMSSAFTRLYDETDSSMMFTLQVDGKKKNLSGSELMPFLKSHKKRSVRKDAAKSYAKGLKKQQRLYTFILNSLLLDKKINDEIRNYKYPQQKTFLSYEISPKIVNSMSSAIVKKYKIGEKFYLAKRKALGNTDLFEWDRYSTIYPNLPSEYSWSEAKDIILRSFEDFSPDMAKIAKMFFDNRWIDAEITKGKRGGGFCSYGVPSNHPYIFINFSGTADDIMTLAHELGHGIHAYLSREQKLLQFWPSTATAEIASIFAEMLVFEKIYGQTKDKKTKINLLANKIQSSFATVFRQNAFFLFEGDLHKHRGSKGELAVNEINNYYQKRLQTTFGSGLKLTDDHTHWWIPVSHFYHYNFYVFSYAFGELLTTSLYTKYKEGTDSKFVKNYLSALSAGGSKSPLEITKKMGVNITKEDFWDKGLGLIGQYVENFIDLTN